MNAFVISIPTALVFSMVILLSFAPDSVTFSFCFSLPSRIRSKFEPVWKELE